MSEKGLPFTSELKEAGAFNNTMAACAAFSHAQTPERAALVLDGRAMDVEVIRSFVRSELVTARRELAVEMQAENSDLNRTCDEFRVLVAEHIKEVRNFRMTVAREVAASMAPLADVRKFFLGADHVVEMERLRDFVAVVEKLQSMKDSGFLDAVADVILRLDQSDPKQPATAPRSVA